MFKINIYAKVTGVWQMFEFYGEIGENIKESIRNPGKGSEK